jgi:hypothetical protein
MGAMQFPRRWIRIAGLVLVVIPLGILLLFAIGETAGGDLYGLQHLVQAVPLAVVAFVAWRWPGVGGPLLAGISALLAVMFFVVMGVRLSPGIAAGTALLFFAPPLVAGLLFWADGRRATAPQGVAGV